MSRQKHSVHNLYTYIPVSALPLDIIAYYKDPFPILPHQTLYPCAASIILAWIPLDSISASYVDMANALTRGMYGEHASIDGHVLIFDESIKTSNPFRQRGNVADLVLDNGKRRLLFERRATIADYLDKDSATVTQFTKPPWSSNGYQEKRVMQRSIVMIQGDVQEQEMLAKAIDAFCGMTEAGDFFLADITYTVKVLRWSNDMGLYALEEETNFWTQKYQALSIPGKQAGRPPEQAEPKEIELYHPPTDWTDDDDFYRFF